MACGIDFFTSVGACPTCGEKNLADVKRDAFIGRTLADRYQVESIIGTGGMGVVYKAWQEGLKRAVAVKVLRHQFLNDEMSVKRFQQEAIAASRLAHPHIVALHDYGSTQDGYLFMVMDVIDGRSLAQEERDKKIIGVDRSIKIVTQVCDALEHAHRNGIVHRDLKPGNIMLTNFHGESDYVKLVDFGIAKLLIKEEDQELTQKGEVFGSPLYMSPEQCLGQDLDGRSDIYSLGTVLYEALTGEVPHLGRNAIDTIDMQIHKDPTPFATRRPDLYIPERLEAVVLKALSKDPAARQQSMKELAMELDAAVPRKNEALNLRAKIEPSIKESSAKASARQSIAVFTLLGILALLVLSTKLFTSPMPSHTVPTVQPAPTSNSVPAVTPVLPLEKTTSPSPQDPGAAPIIKPSRTATQTTTAPETNQTAKSPVKAVNKPEISLHHNVAGAKVKPFAAKAAKTKLDHRATFGASMKEKSAKGKAAKKRDPWSGIEHEFQNLPH